MIKKITNKNILKKDQMCVLETIWKTIEWNRTKKNKCIIKGDKMKNTLEI